MKVIFKDVSKGVVDSRAIIEICEGVYINEVSILRKDGRLQVEFPQKSFKGKDNRMHWMDILTFRDEDKKTLFQMEILQLHEAWRKRNKKVLIYES